MVSGRAEIEVQPDMATFSLSVTERADTTKEAQESVNIKISKVIDILMSEYIIDRNDIKTTYMNISVCAINSEYFALALVYSL